MKIRNTLAEERRAVLDGLYSLKRLYAGKDIPRWHLRTRLSRGIKAPVINGVLGEMVPARSSRLCRTRRSSPPR